MSNTWQSLGSILHNLNNVVGELRLRVLILQKRFGSLVKDDKELADSLQRLDEGLGQIGSYAQQLSESFFRREVTGPVSLSQVLSQALSRSKPPPSVNVQLEMGGDLPHVQATQNLVDVFVNLAVNAFEAMPDGGTLSISAQVSPHKESVDITFSDTGRGMPDYMASSLFQPYFSTKAQTGHGLGLWWSRAYVQSIGGRLELVRTTLGGGSSFLVSLSAVGETTQDPELQVGS